MGLLLLNSLIINGSLETLTFEIWHHRPPPDPTNQCRDPKSAWGVTGLPLFTACFIPTYWSCLNSSHQTLNNYVGEIIMQKFEPLALKPNPKGPLKVDGQFINRNRYSPNSTRASHNINMKRAADASASTRESTCEICQTRTHKIHARVAIP